MEKSSSTNITSYAPTLPLWRRFINKPASEIATDFGFFLIGVTVLYGIDLTLISRSAPVALQYLVQFLLYVNHHAVAAVEVLY